MDTPLMVFLHGPGQSPPVWQDVVSAINPEQPMVAPWIKGLKPTEHDGFQMERAVGAIMDLLDARGATSADLIGYSLGGLVALRTAADYPDKINHLVLISTPIVPSQKAISRQRTALRLLPASAFRDVPKEQMLAGLDALRDANVGMDLDKVHAPVLAIAASGDPMGASSAQAFMTSLGAMVRLLPGSDPNLIRTDPATLAQLLSDFCAGFLDPDDPGSNDGDNTAGGE